MNKINKNGILSDATNYRNYRQHTPTHRTPTLKLCVNLQNDPSTNWKTRGPLYFIIELVLISVNN